MNEKEEQLHKALNALYQLVEDGDLVRNTDADKDFMKFTKQGIKLIEALKLASDALGRENLYPEPEIGREHE